MCHSFAPAGPAHLLPLTPAKQPYVRVPVLFLVVRVIADDVVLLVAEIVADAPAFLVVGLFVLTAIGGAVAVAATELVVVVAATGKGVVQLAAAGPRPFFPAARFVFSPPLRPFASSASSRSSNS